MCGINGFIDFRSQFSSEERHQTVHFMNEAIRYRGPDSEGIFDSKQVTMGMRRLSVIDLNTGEQPIFNEDRTIAIVLNGEIYNFRELRTKLEQKGHHFYTNTDTEVIVHAYEEKGCRSFEELDGMFAFSLYDKKLGKIYIVRDRLGEKPLYYTDGFDYLLFGSELQSIMCTGLIPKQLNKEALNLYLQLTYIPAPFSIYRKVKKLLPGHYLEIALSGCIRDKIYWDLKQAMLAPRRNISYVQAREELYRKMNESIKNRMVSDVPLGAFLSGGVDSGTIVGFMAKNSETPVKTFTIGFNEKAYDERQKARQAARFYHTDHYEYVMENDKAMDIFRGLIAHMGEPFADSSILPTYLVSKVAARHVKVVLTGDAGDELFMGYEKYLMNYYASRYQKLPFWFRKGIVEKVVARTCDRSRLSRKLRKVIDNMDGSSMERAINLMSLGFKKQERRALLRADYYDDSVSKVFETGEEFGSDMERVQYLDLKLVLEGDMLAKVDRMGMQNSIETRTPMLAREIVDFAVQIPMEYKIKGRYLKRILKDTFKPLLPPKFTKYPKSGFGVPLDYWFRNEMKEELVTMFSRERIESQGIFNWQYIDAILNEHFTGKKNRKNEIWALYVFEKWYELA